MITISYRHEFSNGVTVDFTIQKDEKNPIAKAEWSHDVSKMGRVDKRIIVREYEHVLVPRLYQKMADFLGQSILWIDKDTGRSQHFEPNINLS